MVRKQLATKKSAVVLSGRPSEETTKAPVRSKRKSTAPTKKELHRRLVFERKRARAIEKEQKRAGKKGAVTRTGIKKIVKDILQNNPLITPTGETVVPMISRDAVNVLHELAEEEARNKFSMVTHLLEFAGKTTATVDAMKAVDRILMVANKQPVYELPRREEPMPEQSAE